jgi:alkylhydroperoxidase family enzyme
MINRYAKDVARLMETVLTAAGATDRSTREAASRGGALPPVLADYVAKVQLRSHRITNDDIARLRTHGYSEDDIFEITVAAALGKAFAGLDAALRAMETER